MPNLAVELHRPSPVHVDGHARLSAWSYCRWHRAREMDAHAVLMQIVREATHTDTAGVQLRFVTDKKANTGAQGQTHAGFASSVDGWLPASATAVGSCIAMKNR